MHFPTVLFSSNFNYNEWVVNDFAVQAGASDTSFIIQNKDIGFRYQEHLVVPNTQKN